MASSLGYQYLMDEPRDEAVESGNKLEHEGKPQAGEETEHSEEAKRRRAVDVFSTILMLRWYSYDQIFACAD